MKKIYEKPVMETILLEAMEDIMSVSGPGFRGDSIEDPNSIQNKKGMFDKETYWGS